MMNTDKKSILTILNEILTGVTTENISREEIFDLLKGKIPKGEVIRALSNVGLDALLKKNPIVYRVDQLKDQCGLPEFQLQVVAPPPVKVGEKMASHELEIIHDYESADATRDPAVSKFFPTKSYKSLKKRMNAEHPVNVFVWGETGVGKSAAAIHIAKSQGRPAIRVSLSKFSDADDLFGGMRITDGTTYFEQGPVLIAMQLGAVLVLDEVDSADPQLLTDLHPLLERRGYLVKKMKKMVYPAPGFCVIGTANTKGRGDLTGKYIGTGALNRAFLDRFATGVHYDSPTRGELVKIIQMSIPDAPQNLVNGVADWYSSIDNAVAHSAVEEHISPRKILDIIQLMMSDGVVDVRDKEAKNIILEATNLMDSHISQALSELWDSLTAVHA